MRHIVAHDKLPHKQQHFTMTVLIIPKTSVDRYKKAQMYKLDEQMDGGAAGLFWFLFAILQFYSEQLVNRGNR